MLQIRRKNMEMIKKEWKSFVLLHALIMVYSFSSVCSKFASRQEFLSWKFILLYGMVILFLGLYAIGWQQILKKLPLVMAYANKSVTVIWGLLWGMLIFNETITVSKIAGCLIIIVGIYFVVSGQEADR